MQLHFSRQKQLTRRYGTNFGGKAVAQLGRRLQLPTNCNLRLVGPAKSRCNKLGSCAAGSAVLGWENVTACNDAVS